MNSALKSLFARRSVRSYQNREVPEAMVKDILEAAMAAPSAVAKDPWHFIVVRKKETLAKITEGLPNGVMLKTAGVGIVVCGDLEKAHGKELSYLLQDCSAAIQNALIAQSILGLGAVWLGVHPRQERIDHLRKILQLPLNIVPVAVLSIGWPAETPVPRTRYHESAVHMENWNCM